MNCNFYYSNMVAMDVTLFKENVNKKSHCVLNQENKENAIILIIWNGMYVFPMSLWWKGSYCKHCFRNSAPISRKQTMEHILLRHIIYIFMFPKTDFEHSYIFENILGSIHISTLCTNIFIEVCYFWSTPKVVMCFISGFL